MKLKKKQFINLIEINQDKIQKWKNDKEYMINEIVIFENKIYKSNKNHTSKTEPDKSTLWKMIYNFENKEWLTYGYKQLQWTR